jgi:hypothetical protein
LAVARITEPKRAESPTSNPPMTGLPSSSVPKSMGGSGMTRPFMKRARFLRAERSKPSAERGLLRMRRSPVSTT